MPSAETTTNQPDLWLLNLHMDGSADTSTFCQTKKEALLVLVHELFTEADRQHDPELTADLNEIISMIEKDKLKEAEFALLEHDHTRNDEWSIQPMNVPEWCVSDRMAQLVSTLGNLYSALGITNPETPLTGPHLLLLEEDALRQIRSMKAA